MQYDCRANNNIMETMTIEYDNRSTATMQILTGLTEAVPKNNGKTRAAIEKKPHTHKEVFGKLLDKLSVHYGVDMHKLVTV